MLLFIMNVISVAILMSTFYYIRNIYAIYPLSITSGRLD